MIHYIVAIYTGKRRNQVVNERLYDPCYFAKKQLFGLETLNLPLITKATFVVSPSDDRTRDQQVVDYVNDIGKVKGIQLDSFIRKTNDFFSYGSWNDGIQRNIDNDENLFLIEDDYFPCADEFYKPFVDRMEETNAAYVCQLWSDKFLTRACAAISNGLMNINAAREHYKRYKECLNLKGIKKNMGRNQGVVAQIEFLDKFIDMGFNISDISDEYGHPFLTPENRIFLYGERKRGIVIKCECFGEVRTESATYLSNSKIEHGDE